MDNFIDHGFKVESKFGTVHFSMFQIVSLKNLVTREFCFASHRLKYNSFDSVKDCLSSRVDFYSEILDNLNCLFPFDYETNNRDNG